MVVLWGSQCNPMSPIHIKVSKFLNVLLAFKFSKLATQKGACGCLGMGSVSHLKEKIFKNYQIHYMSLKFLKSPKKKVSSL